MRKWLKRLLLWGTIIVLIAGCFGYIFRNDLYRYMRRYMRWQTVRSIARYGAGLPPIDEVRILRIADNPGQVNLGMHRVPFQDKSEMAIVAEKTLTGAAALDLANQWRRLRLHNRYMAGCYDPHHVVQFRYQGKVMCEAVVCFACGNTSLPAFPMRTLVSFEHLEKEPGTQAYLQFKESVETEVGALEVGK